ncbi:MAG: hypothetical protein K0R34_2487 [Herbinix sp.]|nr:hypothetical protein [Herbinix sp.]
MADNNRNIPSHTEVRQIFNDTYNVFYKKWINPDTVYDPAVMMQEARELDRKYNHQDIVNIAALIECIEAERRRESSE